MPNWMLPLVASVALTGGALAQEVGDPEHGRGLVRQWCVTCHVVGQDGRGADVGPALPILLQDNLRTPDEIRGWLANPHPSMPDLALTRQEIEDVVAYLESLR